MTEPTILPDGSGSPRSAGTPVELEFDTGLSVRLSGTVLVGRNPTAGAWHSGTPTLAAVPDRTMTVSKTHFAIERTPLSIEVTDLHSTNGTSIVDPKGGCVVLAPGRSHPVEIGSSIWFGERRAVIRPLSTTEEAPGA